MYPISDALRAHFENGERKCAKIVLNNAEVVDLIITEADIVSDSLSIDRYCATGNKIEIGSAVSAELSLVLNNNDGKFDDVKFEGSELKVEVGIKNVADSYIPCGYFTVDEPPRAFSRISLKALDFMMRYDKDADLSLLPFPCNAETLVRAMSAICDVEVSKTIDFDSFPNKDETLYAPTSQNLTYRQILQWVAQITGTCAFIDWNGELVLSWFGTTSVNITPALRYSGDVLENDIEITGVILKTSSGSFVSGTKDYTLDIDSNELIYGGTEQYKVNNVFNAVSGFKYRPYECSCVPMPYLYPLDKITYTDKNGNVIDTVITNHNFGLNSVSALAAQGETAQKKSYAKQKSITKKEVEAAIAEALKNVDLTAEKFYVKYSPYNGGKDANGNVSWAEEVTDDTVYIGTCATTDSTAPTDPTKYNWVRLKGVDGQDGEDGRGVVSIKTQYYRSTSNVTQEGGEWSDDMPEWIDGTYLWKREVTVFKNPSGTSNGTAILDTSWDTLSDLNKSVSATETAAKDLSKTLAGALGLYSTPMIVNGATVWYYHTNPKLTDSKAGDTILVWNSEGVGVCKSGWVANGNLNFETGATFDGKAVWDILVANKISADNIEAGCLSSADDAQLKTVLDLVSGIMSFTSNTFQMKIEGLPDKEDGESDEEYEAKIQSAFKGPGIRMQWSDEDFFAAYTPFALSLMGYAYAQEVMTYTVAYNKWILGGKVGTAPTAPTPQPYVQITKDLIFGTNIQCENFTFTDVNGTSRNMADVYSDIVLGKEAFEQHKTEIGESISGLQKKYNSLLEHLGLSDDDLEEPKVQVTIGPYYSGARQISVNDGTAISKETVYEFKVGDTVKVQATAGFSYWKVNDSYIYDNPYTFTISSTDPITIVCY